MIAANEKNMMFLFHGRKNQRKIMQKSVNGMSNAIFSLLIGYRFIYIKE